jgi:ribonuclease HI
MPWVRATLKGQRIYARAKPSGELDVAAGKVEVRYKPNDGRQYYAMAKNLSDVEPTLLPDETCGAAEPPAPKQSGRGAQRDSSPKAAPKATAVRVSTDGALIVYTDGACTGNPGPAGIGVVIVRNEDRIELSEFLGAGTNNIAELVAIQRGIEEASDGGKPLVVHTDSQYAIGVLSKGWRAKANTVLIENIRARIKKETRVDFVYVPGHAGVPLNERCDELARLAIRTQKSVKNVVPTEKRIV